MAGACRPELDHDHSDGQAPEKRRPEGVPTSTRPHLQASQPVDAIPLESGDAFVFGGPERLRYHGVSRIVPATAPPELGLTGRFNLTLRQF